MKIVLVDDNLTMRKVLASLFESQGHQVLACLGDGAELLVQVKKHAPDLVCLDYDLPGRNGLELLADMQTAAPDVDVVMITGSNDPELEGQAANGGACGFLRKPFSQGQILDELKEIESARNVCVKAEYKPPTLDLRDQDAKETAKNTAVIVDDSSTVRLLLKGILESIDLAVLEMSVSGEAGVAAVKRHRPAVVCLDVEMPGMSGLEALPLMRQASPNSKIVMITGHPNKGFVEAAIAGGAKGYLLKPVRPTQVEAFMKKLLA